MKLYTNFPILLLSMLLAYCPVTTAMQSTNLATALHEPYPVTHFPNTLNPHIEQDQGEENQENVAPRAINNPAIALVEANADASKNRPDYPSVGIATLYQPQFSRRIIIPTATLPATEPHYLPAWPAAAANAAPKAVSVPKRRPPTARNRKRKSELPLEADLSKKHHAADDLPQSTMAAAASSSSSCAPANKVAPRFSHAMKIQQRLAGSNNILIKLRNREISGHPTSLVIPPLNTLLGDHKKMYAFLRAIDDPKAYVSVNDVARLLRFLDTLAAGLLNKLPFARIESYINNLPHGYFRLKMKLLFLRKCRLFSPIVWSRSLLAPDEYQHLSHCFDVLFNRPKPSHCSFNRETEELVYNDHATPNPSHISFTYDKGDFGITDDTLADLAQCLFFANILYPIQSIEMDNNTLTNVNALARAGLGDLEYLDLGDNCLNTIDVFQHTDNNNCPLYFPKLKQLVLTLNNGLSLEAIEQCTAHIPQVDHDYNNEEEDDDEGEDEEIGDGEEVD